MKELRLLQVWKNNRIASLPLIPERPEALTNYQNAKRGRIATKKGRIKIPAPQFNILYIIPKVLAV